jgi:hypothetical protein
MGLDLRKIVDVRKLGLQPHHDEIPPLTMTTWTAEYLEHFSV